jgi:hypothetical protein
MVDTRGVFSIKLVNKINAKGGWVNLDDVWITPSSGISTYRFSDGTPGTPPAPTPTPQTYDGNSVIV